LIGLLGSLSLTTSFFGNHIRMCQRTLFFKRALHSFQKSPTFSFVSKRALHSLQKSPTFSFVSKRAPHSLQKSPTFSFVSKRAPHSLQKSPTFSFVSKRALHSLKDTSLKNVSAYISLVIAFAYVKSNLEKSHLHKRPRTET